MRLHTAAQPMVWMGQGTQCLEGKIAMEWVVDLVLTLQEEGRTVSPALQRLVPMAEVVVWAQLRSTEPTWKDIVDRWQCSRASAFRWLPALRRARAGVGRA